MELRSGLKSQSGSTETFQAFEVAIAEWDSKLGLPAQPGKLFICKLTSIPLHVTPIVAGGVAGAQDADVNEALLSSVLQASS